LLFRQYIRFNPVWAALKYIFLCFLSDVISKVNTQIASRSHGRLFAIIYVKGTQVKVTKDDIIVVEGDFAPQPGDAIRFEKVRTSVGYGFDIIFPICNFMMEYKNYSTQQL